MVQQEESDLVSMLVKEYNYNMRIGNVILLVDVLLLVLNILFFKEIEIGLYSAIAIYLMGKMIDIVFEGIYFTKLVIIISNKNEEIAIKIGENVKRGTTGLYGKGMYTDEEKISAFVCSIKRRCFKVKKTAKKIDPQLHYNFKC